MYKNSYAFAFIVCLYLIVACNAGKLPSRYLPPKHVSSSSNSAGFNFGNGNIAARPSTQYLAPQTSTSHYRGVSASGYHQQRRPVLLQQQQQQQQQPLITTQTQLIQQSIASARQIPILRHQYNNDGFGNYNFGFATGNGIQRDETGEFKGGWPHGSQSVKGSYSYTGDDGQLYTVNYKADGSGFHAEGAHLPTPPPIPTEIQQSLAQHRGITDGNGVYQHVGAASAAFGGVAVAPSARYLPPQQHQQQQQGYSYARRHY